MTRRENRRCPRHPHGCVRAEHRNDTHPIHTPTGLPASTRALAIRGSWARYIAVYDRLAPGNPRRRRRLVLHPEVTR